MDSPHIILLAHGSRDPRWCQTLEGGLEVITSQLEQGSSLAYLEKADPNLEKAITTQYDAGNRHFVVVPLFFAAGKHLLHDVPELVRSLQQKFPDLRITVQEALGNHREFWQFLGVFLTREVNTSSASSHD